MDPNGLERSQEHEMSIDKGTAVITGASSGIGAVYADRLAARGYDLVLVARGADRLAQVADQVRARHGRQADVFQADLIDTADLARVEQFLGDTPDVTLLVNNAGFGGTETLLNSSADDMSAMISVNVNAAMRLAYAIVPQFVARGEGTLINIGSIAGINPELLNGVYGATKAFVLALSQSLQTELKDTGVQIQVVLPGATATEFWAVAGRPVENLPSEIVMSSEDLVDAALVGLDRGEFVTVPPLQDSSLFDAYESARRAMIGKLSSRSAAPRYRAAA
jgi:short-subunit dehydrogenase